VNDQVTSDWEELYEEYCTESDKLFFEWQDQMRYEKKQIEESLIRGIKQAPRSQKWTVIK
jgi:hypothetical protein